MKAALSPQVSWDLFILGPRLTDSIVALPSSSRRKEAWLKMFAQEEHYHFLPRVTQLPRGRTWEETGNTQGTGLASTTPHDRQQWAALWGSEPCTPISYSGASGRTKPWDAERGPFTRCSGSGCQGGLCFSLILFAPFSWTDTNADFWSKKLAPQRKPVLVMEEKNREEAQKTWVLSKQLFLEKLVKCKEHNKVV